MKTVNIDGIVYVKLEDVLQREVDRAKKVVKCLSLTEEDCVREVLKQHKEMKYEDDYGLTVTSTIAKHLGISHSVINNALRKLSGADLIDTRSLGMKGTMIHVKNKYLYKLLGV